MGGRKGSFSSRLPPRGFQHPTLTAKIQFVCAFNVCGWTCIDCLDSAGIFARLGRVLKTLVVSLSKKEEIGESVLKYLNRLSDTLFVLARYENFKNGMEDVYWQKESK